MSNHGFIEKRGKDMASNDTNFWYNAARRLILSSIAVGDTLEKHRVDGWKNDIDALRSLFCSESYGSHAHSSLNKLKANGLVDADDEHGVQYWLEEITATPIKNRNSIKSVADNLLTTIVATQKVRDVAGVKKALLRAS